MKRSTRQRLCLLMLLSGLTLGWAWAEALQAPPTDAAPAVIEAGAVSRAVSATHAQGEGSVRFTVDGLAFDEVTAWTWQGTDIAEALDAALADGTAAVEETAAGFEVVWKAPPPALRLDEAGRLDLKAAAEESQVTAAAPISLPGGDDLRRRHQPGHGGEPPMPLRQRDLRRPQKRHTGMDFPGAGNAVAIALGTVVRVETLSPGDHGMGDNIILRHYCPVRTAPSSTAPIPTSPPSTPPSSRASR